MHVNGYIDNELFNAVPTAKRLAGVVAKMPWTALTIHKQTENKYIKQKCIIVQLNQNNVQIILPNTRINHEWNVCSLTFIFHKILPQQMWGEVVAFIPVSAALYLIMLKRKNYWNGSTLVKSYQRLKDR